MKIINRLRGILITYSLFLLSFCNLSGQIVQNPCARILSGLGQDSITWIAQPCSNFSGYIVFASLDSISPLLAVDTITSSSQSGFSFPNPGETHRFYRIGMICGTSVSTSIIVSNLRPSTPDIRSVNIVNNSPVLSWYPSSSPEVTGYQVYKENPYGSGNFFPYPTNNQIINGTSFVDAGSGDLLVRYAIVAISPCNTGLLGEGNALDGTTGPHSSFIVSSRIDSCSRKINLNWNPYENWRDGVDFYIIYLRRNNGSITALDSVINNAFVYDDAQNGDVLEFWIEAREKNQNNSANSNRLTMAIDVNRSMDFLYLTKVTVDAASQKPEITWTWDVDSDFGSAELFRKKDSTGVWVSIQGINSIGSSTNTTMDLTAETDSSRYYYKITATDNCGFEVSSNIGSTIFLNGNIREGFINRMTWTDFDFEMATIDEYKIHKVVNTNDQNIATLPFTQNLFFDKIDLSKPEEAKSCYYVIAESGFNIPDAPARLMESASNIICLQHQAVLWFPNALVPDGKNNIFKPLIGLGNTISSYSLQIYDRNGGRVFESTDLQNGWDGRKAGEVLPQGIYAYIVRYTLSDGSENSQDGTVMLVR